MVQIASIYAGTRDITRQVADFEQAHKGSLLDGRFSKAEQAQYLKLLTYMRSKGAISDEDFTLYKEFIESDCTSRPDKDALFLALRENVVAFIESDKFDKAPKPMQATASHLATDVTIRINGQRYALEGSPKYGTAVEKVDPLSPDPATQQAAATVGAKCEQTMTFSATEVEEPEKKGPEVIELNPNHSIGTYTQMPPRLSDSNNYSQLNVDPRFRSLRSNM